MIKYRRDFGQRERGKKEETMIYCLDLVPGSRARLS